MEVLVELHGAVYRASILVPMCALVDCDSARPSFAFDLLESPRGATRGRSMVGVIYRIASCARLLYVGRLPIAIARTFVCHTPKILPYPCIFQHHPIIS